MSPSLLVSVALGGAAGAVGRFLVSYAVAQRLAVVFPWGTLVVNVAGSYLLGALYEVSAVVTLDTNLRAMVTIGFVGAFTTFSTFALETVTLLRDGEWGLVAANVTASLFLGLAACLLGVWTVRLAVRLVA